MLRWKLAWAVSYTHLDVYKRQILLLEQEKAPNVALMAALGELINRTDVFIITEFARHDPRLLNELC